MKNTHINEEELTIQQTKGDMKMITTICTAVGMYVITKNVVLPIMEAIDNRVGITKTIDKTVNKIVNRIERKTK